MNLQQQDKRFSQVILMLACTSIVFACLKWASTLIVPFLIALALTVILNPAVNILKKRHIPRPAAVILIMLIISLPLFMLGVYLAQELIMLSNHLGPLKQALNTIFVNISDTLMHYHITTSSLTLSDILSSSSLPGLLQTLLTETSHQLSNYFIIFFLLFFMLLESDTFHHKLLNFAEQHQKNTHAIFIIKHKITHYFLIKLTTSLITALAVFIVLWAYGVKYALLFATLTFVLNFIPVIGSIIAAVPPIVMALLDNSILTAMSVLIWLLVIENIIGNILEPKLMGSKLGISALVVLLSMSFWGWILGPVGMLLSTPLTLILQHFFSSFEQTQWIALMLSDEPQEAS